ncbi:MAG: hypothetical protein KDK25_06615 [Leptospiraceae bacterium]|nr:hypothetical protein [Leptospiraceae bacterium]
MQLSRYLPGFPELSDEEKRLSNTREEILQRLQEARERLESVELLSESSLRDSRLLAEYLEKDLLHLEERIASLPAPEKSPARSGWLAKIAGRFRSENPGSLQHLQKFQKEEDGSRNLAGALREASGRLDYLEQQWKEREPGYLTSRDQYTKRVKRITWITLAVLFLALFGTYRAYRSQPEQKFYRKHLQPLKSVLDPATFKKLESLAHASREDFLRVEDLLKIRVGLESFQNAKGRYPGSTGQKFSSDGQKGPDWIPEIRTVVPVALPVDRRNSEKAGDQYLYISNGTEYKLLAQNPHDCSAVQKWMPELVDPVRGCEAIGYWTEGAGDF